MSTLRPSLLALALLVAACGRAPSTPVAVDPAPAATPAAPAATPAAPVASAALQVVPTSIRYDAQDKMVFVQASLKGAALETRDKPVHVGVTVVTPEGREIDLMVQTLFPGSFDSPVLFSAGIEEPVQDVLIGAWDTRVEPCEVDRYGCREFGFVLDGSLGSWPEGLYAGAPRERILPPTLRAHVVGPAAEQAVTALQQAAESSLKLFGSKLELQIEADTGAEAKQVVVRFAHAHDQALAARIAASVGEAVGATSSSSEQTTSTVADLVVELR